MGVSLRFALVRINLSSTTCFFFDMVTYRWTSSWCRSWTWHQSQSLLASLLLMWVDFSNLEKKGSRKTALLKFESIQNLPTVRKHICSITKYWTSGRTSLLLKELPCSTASTLRPGSLHQQSLGSMQKAMFAISLSTEWRKILTSPTNTILPYSRKWSNFSSSRSSEASESYILMRLCSPSTPWSRRHGRQHTRVLRFTTQR